MNKALKKLLQDNPAIWCASESVQNKNTGLSTGFKLLDEILPTHGWPHNSLIEVLVPRWGVGELQLLLPLLVAISRQPKWIAWIAPPFVPYAPALAYAGVDLEQMIVVSDDQINEDSFNENLAHEKRKNSSDEVKNSHQKKATTVRHESLWAMEKILRNQNCGLVMAWPEKITDKAMRRLQIAAEEGGSIGFIFRQHKINASPAALRIALAVVGHQLEVTLLKARGASRCKRVLLDLPVTSASV